MLSLVRIAIGRGWSLEVESVFELEPRRNPGA